MFDPIKFGEAMGEAIRKAVEPLHAEIAALKNAIAALPTPIAGKDGADGENGKEGADGKSITIDDVRPLLNNAIKEIREEALSTVQLAIKSIPTPKDGIDGKDGDRGENGADGVGMAGAMIDRDGNLLATMTNGDVKNLGPVVGKDGLNGIDGIGFESFDLEYISESHEVCIKASAAGRTKEARFPAGGIRPAGYWREGTKAKAAEAWVHDGSLWIATKDTSTKPETAGSDWVIAARKGRDGERGQKGIDGAPPAPIKLKD